MFSAVPLAFLIGSVMPWLDPELVGPTNLAWYPYLFAVFGLVNLWVIGTILFTVANFTRSTIATYAAFVALLVLYFVGVGLSQSQPELRDMLALIDPFGFNTFGEVTRYWTVFDQNERVVAFEGVMMQNRLLWIGIGLVLLAINVATFRFRQGSFKLPGRKAAGEKAVHKAGALHKAAGEKGASHKGGKGGGRTRCTRPALGRSAPGRPEVQRLAAQRSVASRRVASRRAASMPHSRVARTRAPAEL